MCGETGFSPSPKAAESQDFVGVALFVLVVVYLMPSGKPMKGFPKKDSHEERTRNQCFRIFVVSNKLRPPDDATETERLPGTSGTRLHRAGR